MITPEPWKFYDQFESSDRNLTHTACSTFHIYKSSYLWKFLGSLCDLLTFNSLLDIFLLNRDFENCVEQKVIPPRNCRQNLISLKRHFLTFSIIARIIYALMCQTRYIRYQKIHFMTIKQDLYIMFNVQKEILTSCFFYVTKSETKFCEIDILTLSIITGIVYAQALSKV